MLKYFFWPKVLRTAEYGKYYFQQDGARPHTARAVQTWLMDQFGENYMNKDMCPPHTPDLSYCDFYYGVI